MATSVSAQECAPDVPEEMRRRVMEVDGQQGIWFHLEVARCLLRDVSQLESYKRRVGLLESKVRLLERRLEIRDEMLLNETQVSGQYRQMWQDVSDALAEERESSRAWYRQPVIWYTLGVLTAVVVVLSFGLR